MELLNPLPTSRLETAGRVVLTAILGTLFAWTLWWNIGTLNWTTPEGEPVIGYPSGFANSVMRITGLRQRWTMFLVAPDGAYGWVSVTGHLADGSTRELLVVDSDPETWYRTNDPMGAWRKYSTSLWNNRSPEMLTAYADYFCRQFAAQGVTGVDLIYNYRRFHAPGEAPNQVSQRSLLARDCHAAA